MTGPAAGPEPGPRQHVGRQWELTDDVRAAIHAAVDALPPMTDEQIDALAEIIITARERRRRARQAPPANPEHD